MICVGVNAFHGDSAACIVADGQLVAAVEEERFTRVKHWAGFPVESIRYCLRAAGVDLADVDTVAVNADPNARLWQRLRFAARRGLREPGAILDAMRRRRSRGAVPDLLAQSDLPGRFRGDYARVEHHTAHLASAFLTSPFARSACLSIDGFGDFASAAWGTGTERSLEVLGRVVFPHSLGAFYQAVTQYLGFPAYGDEYKVMGLAAYGGPGMEATLGGLVRTRDDGGFELDRAYFRHFATPVPYRWNDGEPRVAPMFTAELEMLLGPARSPDDPIEDRHRDIAHAAQKVFENALFHLLGRLHAHARVDALSLAGGCAMNSVANGRVYDHTPFARLHVQPAAGDAGGAIGAALVASGWQRFEMTHAYWGPGFSDRQVVDAIERVRVEIAAAGCVVERHRDPAALNGRVAEALAAGAVVGWFQGRMEWGPRALGNRSILGDPRRADMRERINHKIKRRESFRPFAPVVLMREKDDWFDAPDSVPFMMKVFPVRSGRRADIPAVTHVDGSARLQTVSEEQNPRLHTLIEAFRQRTGVPMLLNTSFNENEPIVCGPTEALDCFLRTEMDIVVLGDHVVARDEVCKTKDDPSPVDDD